MDKILMIVTSHDRLGDSGEQTGIWLEEFTSPYYILRDGGYEIDIFSPKGGCVPVDPKSLTPENLSASTKRWQDEKIDLLAHSRVLRRADAEDYCAVFYPGGHGPMWDLSADPANASLLLKMAEAGKPIGAVCHGPAALLGARSHNGTPWVSGRRITGFSNAEEQAVKLDHIVPFLLENEMKRQGAKYVCGLPWRVFTVTDGNLVTGQNPQSAAAAAEALLRLL